MIEQASLVLGDGNWAVKSDSLLGYKIIDGKYYPRDFTFTRATTGTRVNAAGLVELVPYNLLQYSEQFDNAAWSKIRLSVTANTTTSPNGTSTADSLIENTDSNTRVVRRLITDLAGGTYTFSVYAKANTRFWIYLSNSVFGSTFFNLSNGTIGSTPVGVTASIENVGNGWYRCVISFTSTSTSYTCDVGLSIGNNISSYTGDGTSGLYLWGAQLVEGTEPLDYLPTTDRLDIPRIDYSTGEAALLLEPQRTNLLLQSSSFDNATWLKTNATITADTTTAPDGTLTADLFTETTFTNSSATVGNSSLISVTSGVAYTTTVYAKKGNDKYLYLSNYYNLINRYYTLIVDLESGTITKEQAGSSITSFSSSITSVGDGWYRISLTQTTAATQFYFILRISNSATPTIDASYGFITIPSNNNRSLYIWGAQLEAGSYATSYIPTTAASVTRNADVCSNTNASTYIGQTEGTIFTQFNMNLISEARRIITLYNDINNYISLRITSGNSIQFLVVNASATQVSIVFPLSAGVIKLAAAYKVNDFVFYVNGIEVGADTNGTVPTTSSIYLGYDPTGASQIASGLTQSTIWKERLTNAELAQLTTL